jgi:hypothetical protein
MAEQEAVVLRFVGSDGKPFNSFFELAQLDLSKSEVTERDGHPTARAVKASAPLKTAARRPCVVVVVVVVVVAATPNYLRQASQNLGKYCHLRHRHAGCSLITRFSIYLSTYLSPALAPERHLITCK